MNTLEFNKLLATLYKASAKQPNIIEVPKLKILAIDGRGDPNTSKDFQAAVEALYGTAYTIKFMPKKGIIPPGYFEYKMPALEGLWDITSGHFDMNNKSNWVWTMMIIQPDFVTDELLIQAKAMLAERKPLPNLDQLQLKTFTEGKCVQMLHLGPYATEQATVTKMQDFIEPKKIKNHGMHHEIYLSDPRRTAPEKIKTILRYPIP